MSATPVHPPQAPLGRGFLSELEGLRALAAFGVLLTHAGFLSGATGRHILPGFLARMDIGVAIFFVLSGFLLYRPHARHVATGTPRPRLAPYALRRITRLVPAWLLVLVGTVILVPESRRATATVWLTNLLQLQSLKTEWDLPGLAQLWSLSTEVMFYVALPALAWLVGRYARDRGARAHLIALGGLAACAWAFRLGVGMDLFPPGFSWNRTLPATGDWFVVGMLLAAIGAHDGLRSRVTLFISTYPWHLYALAACVFWVVTTRSAGPYDLTPPTFAQASVKHAGYGVISALVVAPSALGARTVLSRVLSSSVLGYLGRISYGIFLWHLPLMFAVRQILGLDVFGWGFWVTVVLTFAASCLIAGLSWHLVEAPIQRWAHRITAAAVPQGRPSHQRQSQHS